LFEGGSHIVSFKPYSEAPKSLCELGVETTQYFKNYTLKREDSQFLFPKSFLWFKFSLEDTADQIMQS